MRYSIYACVMLAACIALTSASSAPASSTDVAATTTTGIKPDIPTFSTIPALAWIIFSVMLLAIVAFNYTIIKYYTDKHEGELLPTIMTVGALSFALVLLSLVPIDIYLSPAYTKDSSIGDVVMNFYYILYVLLLVFTFVLIPFAYFYYEEDDEDVTVGQRVVGGCKYTAFLIVILIVLFVIGLFLTAKNDIDEKSKWIDSLFESGPVMKSVGFAVSCLTIVGYAVGWITYTAYGLSGLPIGMLRGRKNIVEEKSEVQQSLLMQQEKKRAIQAKYLSGKKMSKKDEKTLGLLRRQERVLARQGERIEEQRRGIQRVITCLRPFTFVFGLLFSLFSVLIFVSILMTQIDATMNSFCGPSCGYLLQQPWAYNPLDQMLRVFSAYFPLDLILYTIVILYVYAVTMAGVIKVNVRVLWVTLFKIRRRNSPPQGLMLMAIIVVLSLLSLSNSLQKVAPTYTSYGRQTYDGEPCSGSVGVDYCHQTRLSYLNDTIRANLPFFGVLFYYVTWVFLGFSLLFAFWNSFKAMKSNVEALSGDSDESEV